VTTFAQAINETLLDCVQADPSVVVCGQLVEYGQGGGITAGIDPARTIQYPVSEALMNASALGLSLAGMRPVMIHERFEFAMVGPDALLNFIPVWPRTPLVVMAIVGKGKGQGPQQSKDFSGWFEAVPGWSVVVPESPADAGKMLRAAIFGDGPTMYVAHRELFRLTERKPIRRRAAIGFCGSSERHESDYYA